MPDPRGRLLRAALGFAGCSMPSYDRALHALGSWLDSWAGIGHVALNVSRSSARTPSISQITNEDASNNLAIVKTVLTREAGNRTPIKTWNCSYTVRLLESSDYSF